MKELIFVALFMGFLFTILGVFFYAVYRYIRKEVGKTADCWTTTAKNLGLDYGPDGERHDPTISGSLDGHSINVGLTLSSKSSARDVHRKLHQAGTRVDVGTNSKLQFVVVPSSESNSLVPEDWESTYKQNDPVLTIWSPAGLRPELSKTQLETLGESGLSFYVSEGKVSWLHPSVEKDPTRLEKSVRACLAVAKAIETEAAE